MPRKITSSRVTAGDVGKYQGGKGGVSQSAPAKQSVKDVKRPGQGG